MSKKSEQLPEPIRLTVSLIESGRFIRAGEPTPYLCVEDVPAHLKEYIATEADPPAWSPRERDFYNNPQPEPELIYQPLSGERGMRRQAMRAASISQEQLYAEAEVEAANKLSPETEEALQDSHDKHSALMIAQLAHDRDAMDRLYESLAAESAPTPRFVRRGSVYVRIEKAKLAAGEPVFIKHPSGNHEVIGTTDVDGTPPEPPIIP